MPTFIIDATDWTLDHDLGDTGASSRFSVTYQKVTSAQKWDPAYFNGIKPYRGEASPDLIDVYAEADGHRVLLVRGVADRSGRVGSGGAEVRGTISGRDLMARVLDRYPAAPFTIQGAKVSATGVITFDSTFISAVQQLLAAAGVSSFITGVLDYKLGASIAVTTDRTFGTVLAELLEPLRWSEKHAIDTWFEDDRLYVVGRDTNHRGTREVQAARVFAHEFENTSLPAATDVRVDGWTFQKPVDDIPSVQTPGMPWTVNWENQPTKRTVHQSASGKNESYEIEEIEYYNVRGQMYASFRKKTYLTKARTETRTKALTFDEDQTRVTFGSPLLEAEQLVVRDIPIGGGVGITDEVISDISRQWTYYQDNGDVRTMEDIEVKRVETGNSPLPIERIITKNEIYRRSAGHIMREFEYVEEDADGSVLRTVGAADLGPFRVVSYGGGLLTGIGKKMQSMTIGAGSESSLARFRSDLLGDQASVDQIRTWLIDERASIRQGARFRMAPKLDVRPACRLTILSAPTDWPASTGWFVLSLSARRSDNDAVMDVEAVRWVAA